MAHSRLSPKTLALVPQPLRGAAERPAPGIVHLGIGAFFRAQTALYTQEAIAAAGGDWGVIGVSLRSPRQRDLLAPQDFLYTAIERDAGGARATHRQHIARDSGGAGKSGAPSSNGWRSRRRGS